MEKNQKGFLFIEILVASTILAMIVLMIFTKWISKVTGVSIPIVILVGMTLILGAMVCVAHLYLKWRDYQMKKKKEGEVPKPR